MMVLSKHLKVFLEHEAKAEKLKASKQKRKKRGRPPYPRLPCDICGTEIKIMSAHDGGTVTVESFHPDVDAEFTLCEQCLKPIFQILKLETLEETDR